MSAKGRAKHHRHGRKKPYTQIGVAKLPCFRCGNPAHHQWSICADGNLHRPVCIPCDVEINRIILQFMRFPDWRRKAKRYEQAQTQT